MDLRSTLEGLLYNNIVFRYRDFAPRNEPFCCELKCTVDCAQDVFEIPTGLHHISYVAIRSTVESNHKLVFTLIAQGINRKTIATPLTGIYYMLGLTSISPIQRIVKVKTKNNEEFYIGSGMILDTNYRLLFVLLDTIERSQQGIRPVVIKTTAVVHPCVFTEPNSVNKAIQKLIPEVLKCTRCSTSYISTDGPLPITVEIRDTEGIVCKPEIPTPSFDNDAVNKMLYEQVCQGILQ